MNEEVKDKIQDVTDTVETAAEDVKETVETTAQETKETFKEKVSALKDAVEEKATEVKEVITEKAADVKETVTEKAADVKETVAEKATDALEDVKETAAGVAEEAKQIKEDLQAPKEEPKAEAMAPANQLPTHRGLLKWIFLGLITFGIYNLVILTKMSGEINTVASRHDGKSTMNYCLLVFIVAGLTLGIGMIVWWHRICNRLGNELERRGIDYQISAKTWWGWNVLGTLIGIGPWVFAYKFCKAFNLMNADYNKKG
ncbi:MAG: DUF4234 domain-containing protein [Bacteroidaceae bacterium]|nr:DUF4234 domain-containing protein [Bacteroidaceae bacterium]